MSSKHTIENKAIEVVGDIGVSLVILALILDLCGLKGWSDTFMIIGVSSIIGAVFTRVIKGLFRFISRKVSQPQ